MATDKEIAIISHLRSNARSRLTDISKTLGLPVSAIRAVLQNCKKYIKKYTALVDFEKLGFIKIKLLASTRTKSEFKAYLQTHPNINNLCILNDTDFLMELIFKNFAEFDNFSAELHTKFELTNLRTFIVSEEILHENFMNEDTITNLEYKTF